MNKFKVANTNSSMTRTTISLHILCWIIFSNVVKGLPISGSSSRISPSYSFPKTKNLYFVNEPNDLLVKRGIDALFNCSVAVNGNILSNSNQNTRLLHSEHITWFKDGRSINFGEKNLKVLLENGSLVITNMEHSKRITDEGRYHCKVRYRDLTILSNTAQLTAAVLGKFVEEPRSVSITSGNLHRFFCILEEAAPPPVITWIKDGVEIGSNELEDTDIAYQSDDLLLIAIGRRFVVLPNGTLEINPVLPQDSGSYQCVVKNKIRSRRSTKAILNVVQDRSRPPMPPQFEVVPSDVTAAVGQPVVIECAANGNPTPKIRWTKDGEGFDIRRESRFTVLGKGNLYIKKVQANDEGVYACRASNGVGEARTVQAQLTVHVPPQFSEQPRSSYYATMGSTVFFQCIVIGFPEPSVAWYKNGVLLQENSMELLIENVVHSDSGLYQCFAENPAGTITTSMELLLVNRDSSLTDDLPFLADDALSYTPTAKVTPSAPQNLNVEYEDRGTVKLTWGAPLEGSSAVTHYDIFLSDLATDSKRIISESETFHVLNDVSPGQEIQVKVAAFNGDIPGVASSPVFVHMPTPTNPSTVQSLEAEALSSSEIQVSWEPPSNIQDKLSISKYKLVIEDWWNSKLRRDPVLVEETKYLCVGLRAYTQFTFSVAIIFTNGTTGVFSNKITTQTLEGLPEPPDDVRATPLDGNSIKVSWKHVPKYRLNGALLGYRIRYKSADEKQSHTVEVSRDKNQKILKGLASKEEYIFRVQVYNNVGASKFSTKATAKLAQTKRKVITPPGKVQSLSCAPYSHEISLMWMPPPDVEVTEYVISWGRNNPSENKERISPTKTLYTIKELEPSTNYVISVQAVNQAGPGLDQMDLVLTKDAVTDLYPPVKVILKVVDHQTINVTWLDRTIISDNRYYEVRYKTDLPTTQPKIQFLNTTQLHCSLTKLNPHTQYEVSVRIIKEKWKSSWSMVAINSTFETEPTSPPTDVTIIPSFDNPTQVEVTWQPPEHPNGKITGYLLAFSTSASLDEIKWILQGVVGETLSDIVDDLSLGTKYYFRIKARNNKGYGPYSEIVSYTTISGSEISLVEVEEKSGISTHILYIIIAGGVLLVVFIVVITCVILCNHRKARNSMQSRTTSKIYKGKGSDRYSGNSRSQNGFIASQGTWEHARPRFDLTEKFMYDDYRSSIDTRYHISDKAIMQNDVLATAYTPRLYQEEIIRTPVDKQRPSVYLENSHSVYQPGIQQPVSVDLQYKQTRPSYSSDYRYSPVNTAPDVTSDSAYGSDYPSAHQVNDHLHNYKDELQHHHHHQQSSRNATPSTSSSSDDQIKARNHSHKTKDGGIESDRSRPHSDDLVANNSNDERCERDSLILYENNNQ